MMSELELPAPPLRAVTFDLDGLMFNTEELYQEVGGTILSRRGSVGFQCGYDGQTEANSRPLVSTAICTGFTISGNISS